MVRPRLAEMVSHSLEVPLTLVAAPAGFGKTTLLFDWCDRLEERAAVAWVSLDETDNDPDQLALYLRAALSRASAGLISEGDVLTLEATMAELVNRLAGDARPVVLALDDYHVIDSSRIHAALSFLLEHQPPNLHLLLGTRRDPPLPLARFRARGRLLEVRAEDLRFSSDEAAGLLKELVPFNLTADQVKTLEERTEGWAAALQLAALSIQRSASADAFIDAFSGTHRFVFDYLAEEVFEKQDEPTQMFLLRTAVLERLTGALCDAVTEMSGGDIRLDGLFRANLFLSSLGEEDRWYRYHHLFRDFLRRTLERRSSDEIRALHRRASEWFADHGLLDEAVPHAVSSGDLAWALTVLEQGMPVATMRGEILTSSFERWLRDLPQDEVYRRPKLALPRAFSFALAGRISEAERVVDRVERVISGREPPPHEISEEERRSFVGMLATARVYIERYRGRPDEAIEIADAMMAQLPADEMSQAWLGMVRQMALYEKWAPNLSEDIEKATRKCFDHRHLAGAVGLMTFEFYHLVLCGRLLDAEQHLRQSLQRAYENHALPVVGMLHGVSGELHYERGELDDAEEEASRCLAFGAPGFTPGVFTPPEITLIRVQIVDGRIDEARDSLRQLEERARTVETVQGLQSYPAWIADLRLRFGDFDAAWRWAEVSGLGPDSDPTFALEYSCLVYARVHFATGRGVEVLPLLGRIFDEATAAGRHGRALEARSVEACIHMRNGDERKALSSLNEVLPVAERENYGRTLLDMGEPMLAMLRQVASSGAHASYAGRLLALAGEKLPQPFRGKISGPDEISEREQDVLRLLARGFANREIADELIVSLDIVKTHLRNAYMKLGVHSRTQAITKARERSLV